MPKPLSDNQIGDRLHAALEVIGDAKGETMRGNATLDAARGALRLFSLSLVQAGVTAEQRADELPD